MTYRIWRPITYTSKPDWGVGDATLSGHDDSDVPTWYYMIGTFANYVRFSQLKFQDTKYPDGYPGSSCTNATGGALTGWSANKKGLVIDNCKFNSVWRISPTSYTDYVILLNNIASDVGAIGYEGTGNYGLMENNTIDDAGGGIRGVGNYAVIRGNRLTNLAKSPSVICSFHADGIIAFGTSYAWIINNYFFNTLEGIYLSYTSGGTSNYTIANNVLIGNYDTGSGDYAIYANCAPKTRIYNNTIFGIVGDRGWLKAIGIGAMDGSNCPSPNCEVKNNIIYVPNGEHTWVGTVDANSTVGFVSDYNIIYIPNEVNGKPFKISGGDKTWAEWQAAGYDVHGSISQPTLVKVTGSNWGDLDLRLSSGDNVAKNKGITLTGFTKDIDNITRPQGSAWDIGAYEYTEALTPPNPPKSLRIVSP
jgi:hypothetical protein